MGFKPDQDALFLEIMIPFICLMALVFDRWLIDTHLAPPCGPLHGPMDLLLRGLHHLIKCHLVLPRCRQYVQSSTPNPMPFQQHFPPVQNQASSQQQNPYSSPSQVDHSTWQSPQHCPPTLYDHHQQHPPSHYQTPPPTALCSFPPPTPHYSAIPPSSSFSAIPHSQPTTCLAASVHSPALPFPPPAPMAVLPTPTNNILAPAPSPTIVSSQPQPQPLQAPTSHADMIQPPPQPTPPVASTATDHSTHPAQRHPLLHLLHLIVLRNVPSTHHRSAFQSITLTDTNAAITHVMSTNH